MLHTPFDNYEITRMLFGMKIHHQETDGCSSEWIKGMYCLCLFSVKIVRNISRIIDCATSA